MIGLPVRQINGASHPTRTGRSMNPNFQTWGGVNPLYRESRQSAPGLDPGGSLVFRPALFLKKGLTIYPQLKVYTSYYSVMYFILYGC